MGSKMSSITILVLLFLVVVQWDGASAQSSCTMAIVNLSPCLNYVTGNSSTPSSSCCSRLSTVVDSQPQCLCTLLKGGASNFGIVVNQTLALALPGACKVQTPPVSQCDGPSAAAAPAPAPADSPSESPNDESPDVPVTPSDSGVPSGAGAGSKTVPGRDGPSVGGSNRGATLGFMGTLVLMLSACAFSPNGF